MPERAGRLRAAMATLVGLVYFVPVLWMLLAAFKTRQDQLAVPPKLMFRPTLEHFRSLFTGATTDGVQVAAGGFARNVANSLGIAGVSVGLALCLGLAAAYGFSRLRVPGAERWLFWMLVLRMMPPLVTIVPLYVLFSRAGLGGSYGGIVAVYVALNIPFAVWMLKSFLDDLPRAPEEAAWLDGTSHLGILRKICLPRLGAGLAATAVIAMIFTWNDFLFAQMLTGQDTRTIPIAMLRVMGADVGIDWGLFAAAGTIYLLPVFLVAFLLQGQLLRGVTFGTVPR